MTPLNQCQIWTEQDEYWKIVEMIEAIPKTERMPELESELARAYNNLAGPEDQALFEKALALLAPHEAELKGDYRWNFRTGYALYYLGREGEAMRYFQEALKARPGDEDTVRFIRACEDHLVCPFFRNNFRNRAEAFWEAFTERKDSIRDALAESGEGAGRDAVSRLLAEAEIHAAFSLAFRDGRGVICFHRGSGAAAFIAAYLAFRAPLPLRERWDITAEALPAEEAYPFRPIRDREADWRIDTVRGRTACPELLRGYFETNDGPDDAARRDGIAPGFFAWRLDEFAEEDRDGASARFREELKRHLAEKAGETAVAFIGEADGLYTGYLDILAWDLKPVMEAAEAFFKEKGFRQGYFHTFRRRIGTAWLLKTEMPQPSSSGRELLGEKEREELQGFTGETAGYFMAMFQYLQHFMEDGVRRGRFTAEEARSDLEIALWYAYACANLDSYEWYYRAAQWMPASEARAAGCGTWYYRYSVALMYCGRLEEARKYAEQGTKEEPDYPWIWLQAAKLRSCFGDKEGALAAVERGLFLEPGDHEFTVLREEILRGASIEEMEYHWIDPECDKKLQEGLDESADEKLRSISCITVNEENFREFQSLFGPVMKDWKEEGYCRFTFDMSGHAVQVVFQMNRAGLSKLNPGWLRRLKEGLESGRWLTKTRASGVEGLLEAVLIGLDYSVSLRYAPDRGDEFFDAFPEAERRNTADTSGLCHAAVLLREAAWDQEALVQALAAEGFRAEADGSDAVMGAREAATAVLCFSEGQAEADCPLPAHRARIDVTVIGGAKPERKEAFLKAAAAAALQQKGAAGVLTDSGYVRAGDFREQAENR